MRAHVKCKEFFPYIVDFAGDNHKTGLLLRLCDKNHKKEPHKLGICFRYAL